MTDYWFKRRRYGWGFVPATTAGWIVIVAFLALALGGAFVFELGDSNQGLGSVLAFLGFIAALIAGLFVIFHFKGPKGHWRWGKKPDDNPDEDY